MQVKKKGHKEHLSKIYRKMRLESETLISRIRYDDRQVTAAHLMRVREIKKLATEAESYLTALQDMNFTIQ